MLVTPPIDYSDGYTKKVNQEKASATAKKYKENDEDYTTISKMHDEVKTPDISNSRSRKVNRKVRHH